MKFYEIKPGYIIRLDMILTVQNNGNEIYIEYVDGKITSRVSFRLGSEALLAFNNLSNALFNIEPSK
jgi:hypothetical protein